MDAPQSHRGRTESTETLCSLCVLCGSVVKHMYEIIQHTADIRIRVNARTVESLFEDALLGLMEVIYEDVNDGGEEAERIELESVDQTALLVDFLNEILTRCHVRRRRYIAARFALLSATAVTATVTSVAAGEFHEDVKAVTYHEADVRQSEDGSWETALVLDI
jgi:SHS2 domain-containing protein